MSCGVQSNITSSRLCKQFHSHIFNGLVIFSFFLDFLFSVLLIESNRISFTTLVEPCYPIGEYVWRNVSGEVKVIVNCNIKRTLSRATLEQKKGYLNVSVATYSLKPLVSTWFMASILTGASRRVSLAPLDSQDRAASFQVATDVDT